MPMVCLHYYHTAPFPIEQMRESSQKNRAGAKDTTTRHNLQVAPVAPGLARSKFEHLQQPQPPTEFELPSRLLYLVLVLVLFSCHCFSHTHMHMPMRGLRVHGGARDATGRVSGPSPRRVQLGSAKAKAPHLPLPAAGPWSFCPATQLAH